MSNIYLKTHFFVVKKLNYFCDLLEIHLKHL